MHKSSYDHMERMVRSYLDKNKKTQILDIGSSDINGTYKPLFNNPLWQYFGADMSNGKNVDIVINSDYNWKNIESDSFDVVISGQTFEHMKAPWLAAKEIERICKTDGFVFIIAPWVFSYHAFPIDCWRISHDGMRYLMTEYSKFKELECKTIGADTIFAGNKI